MMLGRMRGDECGNVGRPNATIELKRRRNPERNWTADLLTEWDSLQADHIEGWAWGLRREIVFLHLPECVDLAAPSAAADPRLDVRCGRAPWLLPSCVGHRHLLSRMSHGACNSRANLHRTPSAPALSKQDAARLKLSRSLEYSPCSHSRCMTMSVDGSIWCPRETVAASRILEFT